MLTKPENLPAKTDKDHDYLVSRGWRYIGRRKGKYGWHYYWDYQQSEGCWSQQFIQGDAVARQRRKAEFDALAKEEPHA